MDEKLPGYVKYWINYSKNDCFFNVGPPAGPKNRIGAIKILLMGHSEPLRNMLEESDMAEKGEISLPDIEPKSFKDFLICVYGGSDVVIKHLTFEECAKLLYIAEKYLVAQVKRDVIKKMMKQVPFSINEVFVALNNIVCFEDGILNFAITQILTRDTKELLADKRFFDISSEALLMIVQQQSLNVKELDVFKAVVKWAENKVGTEDGSVLREYISKHLSFIRFRVMNVQEFSVDVIPTGILTAEEACNMCTSIASKLFHNLSRFSNENNLRLFHENSEKGMRLACSYFVENIVIADKYCDSGYTKLGENNWQFSLKRVDDFLALHLNLHPYSNSARRECNVTAELILVNQCGKADYKKTLTNKYNTRENDWGFPHFMKWADVVDPSQGFIKHGSITVVAYITLS